ncbi:alpha/beta fold hydrolase [Halobacillus sp. Marseille-Q1614]|uniref:alpha/beta fold hydrolase n=1 Tax=Halobacillus sp. Marseille-Q1614 TaxID=2709134 RepID=UPI00156E7A2F|nr:alpha/beta hydrolase [Halobacillus sp. Marseille-Q1614]
MIKKIFINSVALIAALLSLLAGIGMSLYFSTLTARPYLFLASGALVYIVCYIGFLLLLRLRNRANFYKPLIIGGIVFAGYGAVLLTPASEQSIPSEVEGMNDWDLPNGDIIAYVHKKAKENSEDKQVIIFLHGGPGTPDMKRDSEYFGQLSEDGYDVYVYDQIGSGHSIRLESPADYSIARDVHDLESIRQILGEEKIILIGHSYGSEIAASYIASYGRHVSQAVFLSPGAINPKDTSDATLQNKLTISRKIALYKELLQPRVLFTYMLLQMNPEAAHNFAGDEETDSRFDDVYRLTQPALHAEGKDFDYPIFGLGFYANQTPQSRLYPHSEDPREELKSWNGEGLIIKGTEDYLSKESAEDYEESIAKSELIYLYNSGHNVYQDSPERTLELIRGFLNK